MIYSKSLECVERLDKWIRNIDSKLNKYPQGELFVARNGKYFKWYFRKNKEADRECIPKDKKIFAERLAQKKLLTVLRDDLVRERRAINYYLRHHEKRPWKSERFLADNPGYQELLLPFFRPVSQQLAEWVNEPYQKCKDNPEKLTVRIQDGSYVRSKSEALIAMILFKYHIPFRYECALKLGDSIYYPDFTIRHPKTGEVYYYEHFGLMDKKSYVQKTYNKLENYALHGIIETKNLITTYETKKKPLDVEYVEMLVKHFLLS